MPTIVIKDSFDEKCHYNMYIDDTLEVRKSFNVPTGTIRLRLETIPEHASSPSFFKTLHSFFSAKTVGDLSSPFYVRYTSTLSITQDCTVTVNIKKNENEYYFEVSCLGITDEKQVVRTEKTARNSIIFFFALIAIPLISCMVYIIQRITSSYFANIISLPTMLLLFLFVAAIPTANILIPLKLLCPKLKSISKRNR